MNAPSLTWKRVKPGLYVATDTEGSRWRVVQVSSQRWEVHRDGEPFMANAETLSEGMMAAEQEADPATRARLEKLRGRRRRTI